MSAALATGTSSPVSVGKMTKNINGCLSFSFEVLCGFKPNDTQWTENPERMEISSAEPTGVVVWALWWNVFSSDDLKEP
jgi:hypothetical protein